MKTYKTVDNKRRLNSFVKTFFTFSKSIPNIFEKIETSAVFFIKSTPPASLTISLSENFYYFYFSKSPTSSRPSSIN